jgi:hypothetical protein
VRLPTGLRIASALATVFWVLATLVVLERGGFEASPLPPDVGRWGTWVLVALLPIGAIMNFASSSRWERFLWVRVAMLLAGLCLVLARSTL